MQTYNLLQDSINHKDSNHKCDMLNNECKYNGVKFLEKLEMGIGPPKYK